jgi:hypothetical protein
MISSLLQSADDLDSLVELNVLPAVLPLRNSAVWRYTPGLQEFPAPGEPCARRDANEITETDFVDTATNQAARGTRADHGRQFPFLCECRDPFSR